MPRRRYVAPKRAAHAAATRQRILAAARRLFGRDGYGATTFAAIATEAQVAVQTVYATFGTKRAILSGLIDSVEAEASMPVFLKRLAAPGIEPADQLVLIVRLNRRLWEHSLDVLQILRGASAVDTELADAYREGEARRRTGQAPFVKAWMQASAVKRGLTAKAAGDVLWTMTSPDVYRLLVVESGWSSRRYETWLVETLRSALFG